ncbi:tRNA (adenosine(37)-N6)-threonylcarbamoyltransferase complex dimerization subunit type 1 TsaB [Pengzhenrongella sp.]|uniref:tRNA (adenosine(37)-N6)-threonylcarbamoyltransferase complex dimerization subunit type 1 TsaB n=1 Tax=Pengzhenrongella sp. TaxID=2888820 RepID=UPI002F94D90D
MFALVIDTSSAAVTAGVVDLANGVRVLAQRVTLDARAHGELLAPSIRASLDDAGRTVAELTAVVVGVGPGPFTGLRVGLVSAAAIAHACGIPAYGVCSLDAIAAATDCDGPLLVAADARRKEVYWASYLAGLRQGEPAVSRAADVVVEVEAMVGAGARMFADVFGFPLLQVDFPTVAGLAAGAADRVRAKAPSEPLTPLYLRRPDAVALGERKPVTQ